MRFPQVAVVLMTVIAIGSRQVDGNMFFRNQAEKVVNHDVVEKVNTGVELHEDTAYWDRLLQTTSSLSITPMPSTSPSETPSASPSASPSVSPSASPQLRQLPVRRQHRLPLI